MRRVVIFGATSAIAQAVARRFAAEGARLCLVGRRPERLAAIAADLRARGAGAVETIVADLTDFPVHAALVAQAHGAFGGADGVLIAHGTLADQARCEGDTAAVLAEIATNFTSAASLLTHLANLMERQGGGAIAVIGSVAGDRGRLSNYVYGSAKGGLRVFVQGLRHRLARAGVRVTLVTPGFVDTPMTAGFTKRGPLWASPERVARDIHRVLVGRGPAICYTPWFWRWIMLVIRLVPDPIFRRMRL